MFAFLNLIRMTFIDFGNYSNFSKLLVEDQVCADSSDSYALGK